MSMLVAFVDTNICLHYPLLKDIKWNWLELCGTESVTLMFCHPMVGELDDKKSDAQFSERARKRLREIEDHVEKPLQPNVTVEFYFNDELSEKWHGTASPEANDERICQCVLAYKRATGAAVAVVTEDTGMRHRCRTHGIRVIRPPEELRLENPATDEQKRIKQLEQQIRDITNAQPDLKLTLATSAFELKQPPQFDIPAFLEGAKTQLTRNYPSHARHPSNFDPVLREFEGWLGDQNTIASESARTFKLHFTLRNDGKGPANSVDLHITFPGQITCVFYENDAWGQRTWKAREMGNYKFQLSRPVGIQVYPNEGIYGRSNPKGRIRNGVFKIRLENIPQDETIPFEPFYPMFGTWEDVRKCALKVYIRTQNPARVQNFDLPLSFTVLERGEPAKG
jgi:hypothetical protein